MTKTTSVPRNLVNGNTTKRYGDVSPTKRNGDVPPTKGNGYVAAPKARTKLAPPPPPPPPPPTATNVFNRFEERRRRIAKCADPSVRADALALCTFDEWTDPDELKTRRKGKSDLSDAILKLTQFLIHRTKTRAAYTLQALEFEPPRETPDMVERARLVECAFREALCLAFPPVPGTGDAFPIRRFERVFARFLSGELRTGKISPVGKEDPLANDGVPDGANYFCFAEAVLLFLRLGLRPDFWQRTLRTFVGGAQVFAAAYWDRPRRDWPSYKPSPKVEMSEQVILALVDQLHAGMDVTQLARQFGVVAAVSLRQDEGLPQPAPIAKELQ